MSLHNHWTLPSAILLLSLMPGEVGAAEPLPYGHPDFVPTPEKPIFFRAGNGEYPGATPPLEWWEGTPVQREAKDEKGKATKVWDVADAKSKNILWKTPVPGWGLSHPIVVGKKVFAVGHPDFVTCYDADTGKQLWQRRIGPLLALGRSPTEVEQGQKILDLAAALHLVAAPWAQVGQGRNSLFDPNSMPKGMDEATFVARKREVAAKVARMVEQRRQDVQSFRDQDLVTALGQDLAILKAIAEAKDSAALLPLVLSGAKRSLNLEKAVTKKLGIPFTYMWQGYIGDADSTLCSDGRRLYGIFRPGQLFCLDLEGKVEWIKYFPNHATHCVQFAMLLCGDLLIARHWQREAKNMFLTAYDSATGRERWRFAIGNAYTVPRLMCLTKDNGALMDVLIGDTPDGKDSGQALLRVADGRLLGHLPKHNCGRGAVMGIRGDVVIWTSVSDTGGGPSCSYRLKVTGPDQVTSEKIYVLGETNTLERIFHSQGEFPTMFGDLWIYRKNNKLTVYDAIAAKAVARISDLGPEPGAVVAGRYLILPFDAGLTNQYYGRPRDDRKAMLRYAVVDLSDRAKPTVVSDRNLLGYADPPADIIVKNYLSEFNPYDFAGCYHGSASYFALMGGPVPHGSRLYIQSSAYLYCIGAK